VTQQILWFHFACLSLVVPYLLITALAGSQLTKEKAKDVLAAAPMLSKVTPTKKEEGCLVKIQNMIPFYPEVMVSVIDGNGTDKEVKVAILPGDQKTGWFMLLTLLSKFVHVFTDLSSVYNYYNWHHYQFGTVILTMYLFHVHEHWSTYADIKSQFNESCKKGYFTDKLIRLQDSQATMQGIPTLAVLAYALPYAVHDRFTLWQQLFNLMLAVKAVADFRTKRAAGARLRRKFQQGD